MTNAELHVQALVAQFGEPPFILEAFQCRVLELAADGNTVLARVEWAPDAVDDWVVPDPEVLVPDPAGSIERQYPVVDDDGMPTGEVMTVRFREDPIVVASAELASFLRAIRG